MIHSIDNHEEKSTTYMCSACGESITLHWIQRHCDGRDFAEWSPDDIKEDNCYQAARKSFADKHTAFFSSCFTFS